MDFSKDEMSRRFKGLNEIMETNNLNGVIIMGDTVLNAPAINVSQRYFTQNNLIESFQIMFCEKDGAPILISASPLQYEANKVRSQITDCVVSPRQIETLVEILREKNLCTGRIGCMLDMIPASWYIHLNREVPELALVEIGRELTTLHYRKSNEEIEKARTSAYMADKAYESALAVIRPGRAEYEVTAEIEYVTNKLGACKNFSLITSGNQRDIFANGIPKLYPASKRIIATQDSVILEITPQFDGYWTQLLRTICVSERPSIEMEVLHRVCVSAIKDTLSFITPGISAKDIWEKMNGYVTSQGFVLNRSLGHVASVDLVDDRLTADNTRQINCGEILILHPCVVMKDGTQYFSWGQTYLVTKDGAMSLNQASDDLICVSGNVLSVKATQGV